MYNFPITLLILERWFDNCTIIFNSTRTFVPVVIDVASVLLGNGVDDVEVLLLDTGHVHPRVV